MIVSSKDRLSLMVLPLCISLFGSAFKMDRFKSVMFIDTVRHRHIVKGSTRCPAFSKLKVEREWSDRVVQMSSPKNIGIDDSHEPRNLRRNSKILRRMLSLLLITVLLTTFVGGPTNAATTMGVNHPAKLEMRNVLSAAVLLASFACLPLSWGGMGSLARSLTISASRCAVQVSLMGSVVLQKMMSVTQPAYIVAWVLGVGFLAGRESIARIQYTYPKMERNMYLSVLTGGFTVLGLTLGLQLLGNIQPWYDPRTWISIAGMLFGNTLNASALGAATITTQFATQADATELRLLRGATVQQAVLPLMEESYRTALTPTINGLAATGIVHIPGMMTGQILAGQSTKQAALYQIMINFLIATVATFTCQLVVRSSVAALVDSRGSRLRSGILLPKKRRESNPSFSWRWISKLAHPTHQQTAVPLQGTSASISVSVTCIAIPGSTGVSVTEDATNIQTVLELKNLNVKRAGIHIDNLVVKSGDRIGVTGKSGVGKSQLLRTIVGLEESVETFQVRLLGEEVSHQDLTKFRRKAILVPQNVPNLGGTPRQLFGDIQNYGAERMFKTGVNKTDNQPVKIAAQWGLDEECFDMPWSTLSGGQAQRISLAIAVSMQPKVLFLDEATNALDEETSMLVEETLIRYGIPIIVVTHSKEQLRRFCTHQIDLV